MHFFFITNEYFYIQRVGEEKIVKAKSPLNKNIAIRFTRMHNSQEMSHNWGVKKTSVDVKKNINNSYYL